MKAKLLSNLLKGFLVVLLVSTFVLMNAEESEFEDPCGRPNAIERAGKFIGNYITNKWNTSGPVAEAKEMLKLIETKKLEKDSLAAFIDMSMYEWACKNGYTIRNTNNGFFYFLKNAKTNKGIFVGLRPDGYLGCEGVRRGYAKAELDTRGRYMDTFFLQVVVSKLKADPNEKPDNTMGAEAQKVLDSIIEHAYVWGKDYYTTIIAAVEKK